MLGAGRWATLIKVLTQQYVRTVGGAQEVGQLSGGCIDPETRDQPGTNGTQVVRYRCAAAATTLVRLG